MDVISRAEAKKTGSVRYFSGVPCPYGHVDERLVSDYSCTECNRIKVKKKLKANPGVAKARISKHYKTHPYKQIAKTAKRRAAKDDRTPPWLDACQKAEIDATYMYCRALRDVGIKMAVDHEVPLRGHNVSGLHVPWNMQVIHQSENSKKGNKHA